MQVIPFEMLIATFCASAFFIGMIVSVAFILYSIRKKNLIDGAMSAFCFGFMFGWFMKILEWIQTI